MQQSDCDADNYSRPLYYTNVPHVVLETITAYGHSLSGLKHCMIYSGHVIVSPATRRKGLARETSHVNGMNKSFHRYQCETNLCM